MVIVPLDQILPLAAGQSLLLNDVTVPIFSMCSDELLLRSTEPLSKRSEFDEICDIDDLFFDFRVLEEPRCPPFRELPIDLLSLEPELVWKFCGHSAFTKQSKRSDSLRGVARLSGYLIFLH